MDINIKENDGDMLLVDGELIAVSNKENIVNELACVFNTWKEEWFLNPAMGIDYEMFFDKQTTDERRRFIIIDGISQVKEITEIRDIDIKMNNATRQAEIFIKVVANDELIEDTILIGGV